MQILVIESQEDLSAPSEADIRKKGRKSEFSMSFKQGRVRRWKKTEELKTYFTADFYLIDTMNH